VGLYADRIAPALFERMGERVEPEFAPFRRALLEDAHGRVLEIGGGTGFNLPNYPATVDELVVTEPATAMLERAKRRAGELGRSVELRQARAEDLPFPDDSFDTVVSTLVLCSVDDQARALQEIKRVLKPGGRLLFIEHVRADDARLRRWQDRLERPWRAIALGCHPNRATLQAIEAAGFEVENLERGELPKSVKLVRPMITGRAVPTGSP
jgi:SAM-dependent methyltransferase